MSDRGIIFSGAMVQALLAGRKTQTRRLASSPLSKILTGSTLYVRETVRAIELESGEDEIEFAAGGTRPIANSREAADRWGDLAHYGGKGRRFAKRDAGGVAGPWVPAIHAPRWCSRIELELTASRIEPLHAITDEDAIAEGIVHGRLGWHVPGVEHPIKAFPILSRTTPRLMYAALWDTLHGSGEWLGNPDVLVLGFRVEER